MNAKEVLSSAKPQTRTKSENFDVVILGGGTGSTIAAWTFAGEGKKVAVVDRKYIGGSCPNIACLPSKNVIHSAKVASYIGRSREFGITVDNVRVEMTAVRGRKRRMVTSLNDLYREVYKKTGAEFILGAGKFAGPRTIEVTLADATKRELRGTNVIISTGTHAAMEAIPGLREAQPMTHIEALELEAVPAHLIVLGGGYVGLELSQAMRRFGSRVTLIERSERLLPREDEDVSDAILALFQAEGIDLISRAEAQRVAGRSGEGVEITLKQNGAERTVAGTHLLVATGRVPNTAEIAAEEGGVELTESGFVKVNERLETTAPGVWAIGEVAGSPLFTHVSMDDSRVVRENIAGGKRVTTGRMIPFCLFTDPEFARVGLSEREARAQGVAYRLFKAPMEAVLRARTLSETRGFLKALVGAEDDRILGFTVVGTGGGEIMSAVQVAMIAGLPYKALRDAIIAHPTLAEGLSPLFSSEPSMQNQRTRSAGQK
ncbi:MAG TPA: FAD-dependent oxidoreductase [Candidatus Acidoferrum sp.]|nr:FAD-dependent oxidoreductase [Candidatus Acidoferrum sp.]